MQIMWKKVIPAPNVRYLFCSMDKPRMMRRFVEKLSMVRIIESRLKMITKEK